MLRPLKRQESTRKVRKIDLAGIELSPLKVSPEKIALVEDPLQTEKVNCKQALH